MYVLITKIISQWGFPLKIVFRVVIYSAIFLNALIVISPKSAIWSPISTVVEILLNPPYIYTSSVLESSLGRTLKG